MRRRALLALLAGASLASVSSRAAAQTARVHRLGVLHIWQSASPSARHLRSQLVKSMDGFGFAEGRQITYEWRFAEEDFSIIPRLAAELIATKPDAILTQQSILTRALSRQTATIPIVGVIDDPAREGFTGGGVQPKGNVTGMADLFNERFAKMLEILKSIIPGFSRFAILAPADIPVILEFTGELSSKARNLGIEPFVTLFRNGDDIRRAFASMPASRIQVATPIYGWHHLTPPEIAELALASRVAAIAGWGAATPHGFLLAYEADFDDHAHRQATKIEKILRGAAPSSIPFEFPAKFRLTINRRTASLLKLSIPQQLYLRADEVFDTWADYWKK
jgi:putative ABC transport system substrate-binding protein